MVRKTNRNKHEIREKIEELEDEKRGHASNIMASGDPESEKEIIEVNSKIEALQWVLAKRHEL